MKTSNFSGVNLLSWYGLFSVLGQFVLTYAHVLAGSLNAKELAHCRPELVLPSDKVVFNAANVAIIIIIIIN